MLYSGYRCVNKLYSGYRCVNKLYSAIISVLIS